ncbi:hypothetical protein GCM10009777_08520 [Microbacterium pumilum]|uniref:Uncharacterized protein n=1 Tax=Microbacterium pumilum TaxID=344165 RepID=A0ABP5DEL2_9MICO
MPVQVDVEGFEVDRHDPEPNRVLAAVPSGRLASPPPQPVTDATRRGAHRGDGVSRP